MKMPSIKVGVVARDSHRRIGIVCSEEPTPSHEWIDNLVKSEEVKRLGDTNWWGIMPLEGGYALEAEPLMTYLREATYDDFIAAADNANVAGRETLVKTFPEFVNRLLAERRSSPSERDR